MERNQTKPVWRRAARRGARGARSSPAVSVAEGWGCDGKKVTTSGIVLLISSITTRSFCLFRQARQSATTVYYSVLCPLCVVHTRPTLDDMGGFREPRERVLTHSHSPPPPWCLSSVFVGVRVDPESPRPPSALSRLCLENRLVVKVFRAGWVVGTMFRV